MVGGVIDDVEDDLPERRGVGISLQILVFDLACERGFVLRGDELLPLSEEGGPIGLEGGEEEVLFGVDELGRYCAVDAVPPDAVGGEDVGEGSQDGFLARFEIVREFSGSELSGGGDEAG